MKTLSYGFAWLRRLAFVLLFMGIAGHALAAKTYSDNGDGTVTDPTTGLVWMRCAMGQTWDGTTCSGVASTYTFPQANALTGKYTFAMQSDWRLPNILELLTIVDTSNTKNSSDTVVFPFTYVEGKGFWSDSYAEKIPTLTRDAWSIFTDTGIKHLAINRPKASVNSIYSYYARLVRGAKLDIARPNSDYDVHSDGTVTHKPTGLVWQRCAVGQTLTAERCSGEAGLYTLLQAKQLVIDFAGETDWRLPTEEELLSLVDFSTQSTSGINASVFPDTPTGVLRNSISGELITFGDFLASSNSSSHWGISDHIAYNYGSYDVPGYIRLVRVGRSLDHFVLSTSTTGTGTVSSSALGGIYCGTACTGSYTPGTTVILSAAPSTNVTWGGACTGNTQTCTVTMDAPKSVTASFKDTALVTGLPSDLTFSTQTIGSPSPAQTVALKNTGATELNITSITTSGDFVVTNNCGTCIGVGSFCSLYVSYKPTVTGKQTGILTITDDALGSPHTISLTGTGLGAVATLASLSGSTVFPNQIQFTTSAAQTITLTNSGGAVMNISSITAGGDFARTTTCGATLTPSASCSISVTFTPRTSGTQITGTVVITSNAVNNPSTINLYGTGIAAPAVSLSQPVLNFSTVPVSTGSAVQTVKLNNVGDAILNITSINANGDFNQTNNCGLGLSAGGSCTVSVTFTPKAAGVRSGTLSIISDAPGSPHTVALGGDAVMVTTTTTSTTTSSTVTSTTTTTLASTIFTITLSKGWSLLGNGTDQPLTMTTLVGDQASSVTTVWKWDVAQTGWQFYAPSMDATALQTYATNKSYGVLSQINAGEGFWVNAANAFSVTLPSGTAITASDFQDGRPLALKKGWNLIAIGSALLPSAFNMALSASPPTVDVVPLNLTTLWAWDNLQAQWYFYAPNLEAHGGTALTDYIVNKGYFDFTATHKLLGPGMGFWVNKP